MCVIQYEVRECWVCLVALICFDGWLNVLAISLNLVSANRIVKYALPLDVRGFFFMMLKSAWIFHGTMLQRLKHMIGTFHLPRCVAS